MFYSWEVPLDLFPNRNSVTCLVDSGATSEFIDWDYAKSCHFNLVKLRKPILVYNIDGTPNEAGSISEVVHLILHHKNHSEQTTFAVTCLGKQKLLLRHSWLRNHNPEIDWVKGEVKMFQFGKCTPFRGRRRPDTCHRTIPSPFCGYQSLLHHLAEAFQTNSEVLSLILDYLKEFTSVFSKQTFDALPESRELSEDTFAHWSLWQNMSILTLRTHSASPTLHTSLHINVKLHFPQVASSVPLSVSTPKHRRKRTPSYPASESESCHCCMYYHCVASLFYFPLFL